MEKNKVSFRTNMNKNLLLLAMLACIAPVQAQRFLKPSDIYKLKSVSEPEVSPDAHWVAYTVSTPDSVEDSYDENIWMSSLESPAAVQLTHSGKDESSPKWSPDGKYISFLSSRYEAKEKAQVWLMNRQGGEAYQLTKLKSSISYYAWSPDGKKLVLVVRDQKIRPDSLKEKPEKPIVINRYHFKEDGDGYLEHKHAHLYLFDVETKKLDTLTQGNYDHSEPAWSPDGKWIAFTSNRSEDPDRNTNSDIWIVEAKPKSKPRQLTTWVDYDRSPVWSPDGKSIAYLRSASPEWDVYDEPMLAVVPVTGGAPVLLSEKLDRPVSRPQWSADGKSVFGLIEDDRKRYVMEFNVATHAYAQVTDGEQSITWIKPIGNSDAVVMMSDPAHPGELYRLKGKQLTKITAVHTSFLTRVKLAGVEGFTFKNREGLQVGGLLYWPAGKPRGQRLPLILWIHGGPVGQDEFEFEMTPQMLAAQGYAVACINYRGSNGRGYAFSKAIFGDWGNKEVVDLIDGVDHLIKAGYADEKHLGIGGWSYGGILTDYTTATDPRFKAAASGAGSALQLTMYGTDQYTQQYEMELGVPWKNMDKWMKVSYPFLTVEKIKAPTLYMVGEKDFNVPATGSEQMYQALKSLGVPTELIIYPNQHHGLKVPGYLKDRYERYIAWYSKYLK
jgi:dipeptidyl aminopeptidase/acylaminoacyl peptidase